MFSGWKATGIISTNQVYLLLVECLNNSTCGIKSMCFQTFSIRTELWKLDQTELLCVMSKVMPKLLGNTEDCWLKIYCFLCEGLQSLVRSEGGWMVTMWVICFWVAVASFHRLSEPWLCADHALSSGSTHYVAAVIQTSNAQVGLLSFICATWLKLETSSFRVNLKK